MKSWKKYLVKERRRTIEKYQASTALVIYGNELKADTWEK
jgi:hypothetical protein